MSDEPEFRDERAAWDARYRERGSETARAPSQWVVDRCTTLPANALVLDVAGGSGRNAAPIAGGGKTVVVTDFIERAVASAVVRHPRMLGVVADASALPFRRHSFGAIVCVSFLDRSLFEALVEMLKPGASLIYETFTTRHLDVVARGRAPGPQNPDYLLEPDELPRLVAPLVVLEHEEGLVVDDAGERHVARVMAVKS